MIVSLYIQQDKHGLALADASHRWLQHHSALEQGDAVILGAASVKQLRMNITHWYVSDIGSGKDQLLIPFSANEAPCRRTSSNYLRGHGLG